MSNGDDPWGKNAPTGRSGVRTRVMVWLALVAAAGLLVWRLDALFPGQVSSDNFPYLIYWIALLALLSSGVIFARRIRLKETLRNIAIWAGIAAVLLVGYAYQDELRDVAMRVRSSLIPGYAVASDPKVLMLTAGANGHFYVFSEVNGTRVKFLIDTGASDIVLSPSDARRIGIDVQPSDFSRVFETANGLGRGAPVTLKTLTIGAMELTDVRAWVNQADMSESLLGMSFLKGMALFEIQGQRLFLRWRE